LAIYNNEFILGNACVGSEMIKRIATNTSNSYYILESYTTSSLLQHVFKMFSSSKNAIGGRWLRSLTARSVTANSERLTRCWCVISLHRRTNRCDLKINTISVKWITDFQWFCGLSDFL